MWHTKLRVRNRYADGHKGRNDGRPHKKVKRTREEPQARLKQRIIDLTNKRKKINIPRFPS